MAIRKNIKDLTTTEKSQLVDAIKAMKQSGKYDQFVLRHAQAPMSNIHRAPAFLPWHRQYILEYEKELQTLSGNPDLGLPYWNWAEDEASGNPENAPIWAEDFMGGNGDPDDNNVVKTGAFREGEWVIVAMNGNPAGPLIREFAANVSTLPTQADIDDALSITPFDAAPWNSSSNPSFRNRLEGWYGDSVPGLHNRGHVWVGGSMLPMTSPNDPVFFLHHCMVDKIWADWQEQHPTEGYLPVSGANPSQNLNDLMEATLDGQVTPADVWNIDDLGYSYDTSSGSGGGGSGGSGSGGSGSGGSGSGGSGGGTGGSGGSGSGGSGSGDDGSGSGGGTGGSGSGGGTDDSGGRSGRCFVATATMGDYKHPVVVELSAFRDQWLLQRLWGKAFVQWYYTYGPYPARIIRNSTLLRKLSLNLFIKPLSVVARWLMKS